MQCRPEWGKPIPFLRTGWADVKDGGLGTFDLIIGSDILYEEEHADLLAAFVDQHAHRHCDVVIVDPGRGHHPKFSKKMIRLGYSHSREKPQTTNYLEGIFKGWILTYSR